jgi:2-keto-4-pentenoate hydratase
VIDPRIERGMRAMLELRRARLAAGERPLGWKVGFGAPAALERLGIDRPLVGFLTDRGLLDDGAEVAIGDWAAPMLEAEIAVHLARDVGENPREAFAGLSAAIELADVDPPSTDPEAILAGNIYHRHVILGPVDRERSTAEGVTGRLLRDGDEVASTDTPEALTGDVVEVVRLTAELLAASGERLRAGDVVITGSMHPPLTIAPGERVTADVPPLGSLTVALRA